MPPQLHTLLLLAFFTPNLDLFELAFDKGLSHPEFLAWIKDPQTRQDIEELRAFHRYRAQCLANAGLPQAVVNLQRSLEELSDIPSNTEATPSNRLRAVDT